MHNLTIIGLGNMGKSLVRGLLKSSWKDLNLSIFDRKRILYNEFKETADVNYLENLKDLPVNEGSVIIICVKPQDLPSVAIEIKDRLSENTLILSIMAGKTIDQVSHDMDFRGPIIRAMPNIAATVGSAATAMCKNEHCTTEHAEVATRIFSAVGEAFWTKENLMDAVTGLSGSGPAYIYMVIEALIDGGVNMGLPRELASNLATQTVLGAATLVKESKMHPAILKDQVTTPAGTTISALVELESHGLRSMFVSAVVAATERSKYLGKKLGNIYAMPE